MNTHLNADSVGKGGIVEVRTLGEIAATLDQDGCLDGLPFMPEMAKFCGRRIEVARRADRTCVVGYGMRGMRDAVFLQNSRCGGELHDGCQRACQLFWKEAWLRSIEPGNAAPVRDLNPSADERFLATLQTRHNGRYHCQSTSLYRATYPISRWDVMPFLREIRRGDLSVLDFLDIVLRTFKNRIGGKNGQPWLRGKERVTPQENLALAAGELVHVKSKGEICATLDARGANHGLMFQETMDDAIDQPRRVAFRVHRIIREDTGQMVNLRATVALEDVVCQGVCVLKCPRAEYLFWREAWLRRIEVT